MVKSKVNMSKTELEQSGICVRMKIMKINAKSGKKPDLKVIRIFHKSYEKERKRKKGKLTVWVVLPPHSVHTK
jgi:hypothetical protein